jgi:hypothetical protein
MFFEASGGLRHENTVVERLPMLNSIATAGGNVHNQQQQQQLLMEYQQNFAQMNATTASAASSPAAPLAALSSLSTGRYCSLHIFLLQKLWLLSALPFPTIFSTS